MNEKIDINIIAERTKIIILIQAVLISSGDLKKIQPQSWLKSAPVLATEINKKNIYLRLLNCRPGVSHNFSQISRKFQQKWLKSLAFIASY